MKIFWRPGRFRSIVIALVPCISLACIGCIGVTDILAEISTIVEDALRGDVTPPGEASNLMAVPGNELVFLTWTDPEDTDFDHIEITWTPSGASVQEVSPGAQGITVTGLVNGTTYSFTVISVDESDNISAGARVDATPEVTVISFQVDLPAQPPITISGGDVTLPFESDMTVAADGADSYWWYLDGAPAGTGESVTLGSELETGPYELTVVVQIGFEYYSERLVFTVVSS